MLRTLAVVCACAGVSMQAPRPPDIPFATHMLDGGASETAAVVDINRDGRLDIVSGEHWYEAPRWTKHAFRESPFTNNYIDAFSDLPVDVDGDGYVDIATVTWFGRKISWYRNPGTGGGRWTETTINSGFNVEFAILADLDNDGKALEILAQENGTGQAWYEVRNRTWVRHVVSDRSFGHGIGAGDVDGDGRNDILTPRGWLQGPPDPRAPNWTYHAAWESVNVPVSTRPAQNQPAAGAAAAVEQLGFMHILDVNRDGRNDVVTAAGHDYGVFWFEQGENGQWTRRVIDNAWSQGHASTLVDLNGDGHKDFVTGKRFMAHNGNDPGEREPLGVYWYEFRPSTPPQGSAPGRGNVANSVEPVRHLIDYGGRMGGGMQIPVVDIDRDGDLDLVCAGKGGLFFAENLTRSPATRR
jgi:FG-GAP-like repeat